MNTSAALGFFELLAKLEPKWALILLVAGILSWQSPRIIKELFNGVRGLLLAGKQKQKTANKR